MSIAPTNRTAALAGAWCALGLVGYNAWEEHHATASVASHNFAFLAFAIAFLFVPAYFLVLGHGSDTFGPTWFLKSQERGRYFVVFKRMLSWFLAAGAVMALTSVLFK